MSVFPIWQSGFENQGKDRKIFLNISTSSFQDDKYAHYDTMWKMFSYQNK